MSQIYTETDRNILNKDGSLMSWMQWQPTNKACWSAVRILVYWRYFCLPVFKSHCDLEWVSIAINPSHPSSCARRKHKTGVKTT